MPIREVRPAAPTRIEPSLGPLDAPKRAPPAPDGLPHFRAESRQPAAAAMRPARAPQRARGTPWLRWLLLAVLLLLGLLLVAQHRAWFAQLLPSPQLDHVLDQGDRALAQGHLGDRHPPGARQFYQQAAQISGDNSRALAGLQAVGQAELMRAKTALAEHRLAAADVALKQANALLGGGTELTTLQQQLARQRAQGVQLADLVAQAQQAFAAGRLTGADSAAGWYLQVLQADPGNAVARHGLDQVGAALAKSARQALASGDINSARQQVQQIATLMPSQADLPALQAELASNARAAQQAVTQKLAAAASLIAAGHITTPAGASALDVYQQVLQADPGNSAAQAGLAHVATALMVQAHAQADAGDFSAARQLLDQAATLTPHSVELAAARARLARAQALTPAQAVKSTQPSQPAVPPAQRQQALALVQRAQAAAARGDFLLPPGASAFDLYRRALNLDGTSRVARAGLQALPQLAANATTQALRDGQLERAADMLQNYAQLAPGSADVARFQHALGTAWLELANRDLARGDHAAARSALAQAQRWAPDDARVQALAQGLGGG
jgi:hypothetical protein